MTTDADRVRPRTVAFHACLGNGQVAVVTDQGYQVFDDFLSAKRYADEYLATDIHGNRPLADDSPRAGSNPAVAA